MGYITTESRFFQVEQTVDANGRLVLDDPEPYLYEEREDNIYHVAGTGDTWWGLAQKYYPRISGRACGLYWTLIHYQDPPVVDPTLALRPGTVVVIPPPIVVLNDILGRKRTLFQ